MKELCIKCEDGYYIEDPDVYHTTWESYTQKVCDKCGHKKIKIIKENKKND